MERKGTSRVSKMLDHPYNAELLSIKIPISHHRVCEQIYTVSNAVNWLGVWLSMARPVWRAI